MARLLTYNYFINKYIFNNQICKYNNYLHDKPKSFFFNTTDDVKNFIQYYHVKNHDFGDLSLADEITINEGTSFNTWLIAGFNTQLDSDVNNGTFGKHHLTLVPKYYSLYGARMYNYPNNDKGFAGTEMFNITLPKINNNLSNIFDKHLLPHKMMLSINNKSKSKAFIVKSMLMDYNQAFGKDILFQYYYNAHYIPSTKKYNYEHVDNNDQMPLFKQDVKYRTINSNDWWLKNTYLDSCFGIVSYNGDVDFAPCTCTNYIVVRPFICLG